MWACDAIFYLLEFVMMETILSFILGPQFVCCTDSAYRLMVH